MNAVKLMFWSNYMLPAVMNAPSDEDRISSDLEHLTVEQHMFNKWMHEIESTGDRLDGFRHITPVKLAKWKCWLWWMLPSSILGVDDSMRFYGWKIGHCLNCNADPYDGVVEAWSYDYGFCNGALIRCSKCKQLRWQSGGCGRDY